MSIYSSQTEMGSTQWALFLQDFDFTVTYRPGPENSNADGLSRQCWTLEEGHQARGEAMVLGGGDVATSHRQNKEAALPPRNIDS